MPEINRLYAYFNMQVFDLTHTLENGMPVYPGSSPVQMHKKAGIAADGYDETWLQLSAHAGTHIDCARHFLPDGYDTGGSSADRFAGWGLVIDSRRDAGDTVISPFYLQRWEKELEQVDFLLLHTGWSRYWGTPGYFTGFPFFEPEAARYLTRFGLKGIGIDAVSFDPVDSNDFTNHHILLSSGIVLVENLTNLGDLPENGFLFCCFPLKIKDGDGSPVRAVGIILSKE